VYLEDYVGVHGWVAGIASHGGALYCLGDCWSQWRPLDIPGTHLPYSMMQLLNFFNFTEHTTAVILTQETRNCFAKGLAV